MYLHLAYRHLKLDPRTLAPNFELRVHIDHEVR